MADNHLATRGPQHFQDLDVLAGDYAREWAEGDPQNRDALRGRLICDCLPLADRMARRYRGRAEPLEDLQQVARAGLIKAVDRYDAERGSFTAFAVVTICGEIKRHFRDTTWGVHVTRRMQNLVLDLGHASAELSRTLSHEPTDAELAGHLEISEADVRRARTSAAGHTPLSLSTPIGEGGAAELGDLFGDPDPTMETLPDRLAVTELIGLLPPRIQQLLALRFYGELTQAQIGEELGLSQMHVCRLLNQALTWLRAALLSDVVPAFTGMERTRGPGGLRTRTVRIGATVTVVVDGEADRDTATRLRISLHQAVATASGGTLVLDLNGVPLMDAAGVAVLRDTYIAAALAHVPVTVTGAQPHVARVLSTLPDVRP
jgi:RNA polymerase sigma-B factor